MDSSFLARLGFESGAESPFCGFDCFLDLLFYASWYGLVTGIDTWPSGEALGYYCLRMSS